MQYYYIHEKERDLIHDENKIIHQPTEYTINKLIKESDIISKLHTTENNYDEIFIIEKQTISHNYLFIEGCKKKYTENECELIGAAINSALKLSKSYMILNPTPTKKDTEIMHKMEIVRIQDIVSNPSEYIDPFITKNEDIISTRKTSDGYYPGNPDYMLYEKTEDFNLFGW